MRPLSKWQDETSAYLLPGKEAKDTLTNVLRSRVPRRLYGVGCGCQGCQGCEGCVDAADNRRPVGYRA